MLVFDENKTVKFKGRDGLIIFVHKDGTVTISVRKYDITKGFVKIDQYDDGLQDLDEEMIHAS